MARDCQPFVVGPREGRSIDLGEFGMTVKAAADETAGAVSVLEAEEPPGFGPPIHVHHDAAEAFYVLEGEYVMYLDDARLSARRDRSSLSHAASGTASGSETFRAAAPDEARHPQLVLDHEHPH